MPKIDRQAIYDRDGGLCGFCGQSVPWEVVQLDHIQPRGLGGPTTPENLRPAHRRCNVAAGQLVVQARRAQGLASVDSAMSIRKVPPDLWYRVRKAAAAVSTPDNRVTIREVVLEAVEEWLKRKGF